MIRPDYLERVYAGVLGKIIGVYLGSPIEGWTYQKIQQTVGDLWYYLPWKDRLLVSTDDDITGTFAFIRALQDHGYPQTITSAQIGQTWLNTIIEKRTILWWGGLGNSTEHTAYLRLKNGIPAPRSGSMALNGKLVAEQIGAQIFIDGWAMVSPGDPQRAAALAEQAARVSHDGEAVYAARALAAMEALAFVETNRQALLDCAASTLPRDSVIYRLLCDLREWHALEPDWRKTREKIETHYGYDRYGGNCHMVPNHALILLGFLYGDDDFQKSLMIVNTSGWDTDCNSANLGCLMGIKNGLVGIDSGPDWRDPVADRLYLPAAEGGRAISDALTIAYEIANTGRRLNGMDPIHPKSGARFHFSLPGSVQGFQADPSPDSAGTVSLRNVDLDGVRCLALDYTGLTRGRPARAATATFIPPEILSHPPSYELLASPTLYPGQRVTAHLLASSQNPAPVNVQLYLRAYAAGDQPLRVNGPQATLAAGGRHTLEWTVPDLGGAPAFEIGVELTSPTPTRGTLYLDSLGWEGTPSLRFSPQPGGNLWQRAWVNGVSYYFPSEAEGYRLVQDSGVGLISQGTRDWTDYSLSAQVEIVLAQAAGLALRVQGMTRYYAFQLLPEGRAQWVRSCHERVVLAEVPFNWEIARKYGLKVRVQGTRLSAWIDGRLILEAEDPDGLLESGAAGLLIAEGRALFSDVSVQSETDHPRRPE